MTDELPRERYRDAVAAEVAALEQDIRHHVVDLEEAFGQRDWAAVARIYRAVAELADRLEVLDPDSRTRQLGRADATSVGFLDRGPADLDRLEAEEVEDVVAADEPRSLSSRDERPRWMR